jgi:hypothetical protein
MRISNTSSLFSFRIRSQSVDLRKLSGPGSIVQELAQIKAVIVGRVTFGMICWRDRTHLVPVHRVVKEEALHLLRDFQWRRLLPKNTQLSKPDERTTKSERGLRAESCKTRALTLKLGRIVISSASYQKRQAHNRTCPSLLRPAASALCLFHRSLP